MIGTSQLINAFSRPCFTDTTDIFKDGSGVALYGLDYDASDTGGASGKFGEAAIFNGSSSYINLGDPTSGITTANYSISFWVNTTSTSASYLIAKYLGDGLDSTDIFRVMNLSDGTISFRTSTSNPSARDITSTSSINNGNWHHILFTVEPNLSKLYINGTQEGSSTTGTAKAPSSISRNVTIGRHDAGDNYFNGLIDQVRIYDSTLTQSQVTQLYQENNSTVGTHLFGCIANYNLDGSAKESMGTTAYDGTETDITYRYDGTPTAVDFGVGGKTLYGARFNGSSSYVTSNSLPSIGTGDFTFSCWFNQKSGSSQGALFSTTTQWFAANGSVSPKVLMVTDDTVTKKGDTAYSQDTWNHAVFARESGVLKIYQNGTEVFSGAYTDSWDMTQFGIGVARAFGSRVYYFNGEIDQVRVFNKALSSAEVGKLYGNGAGEIACAYTSTTDNVAYPIANTAYYKLDNNSKDSARSTGKFNEGAIFNGSSSKIESNVLQSTNMTFSCWFKTTTTGEREYLMGFNTSGSAGYISTRLNANDTIGIAYWNGSTYAAVSSSAITRDTNYNHICITISGTSYTIYYNGSSIGSGTLSGFSASSRTDFVMGFDAPTGATGYMNGSLDQVRIYNTALDSADVSNLYAETVSDTSTLSFPSGKTAIATYQLDGNFTDLSGNYNGTDTNVAYAYDGTETNIEYRFGRYGQAAVFNGSSSKIVLPTSTFSPSTFTLSAWCNVTSDTAENTILELFDNQTYPNHTTIVFAAGSSGYSSRFLFRNYTTNQYNYNPSGTVQKNVWKHYAMTYDGSTVKSYIDGFLVDSGSLTLSNTVGTISSIQIGLSSGTRYLNGAIDQVRIFSTALSSSQVTQLYNEKPEVDTSNFKTVLYAGNGGTQYISNVGFDLDVDDGGDGGLVWIKSRTTGASHSLQDTVNGEGQSKNLYSDNTGYLGQYGQYGFLSTFEANGFFVDAGSGNHTNANSQDYAAWVWKGGGLLNKSASFNGSSSYIDTGISSLGANFSVSMWINEDALGSGGFFGNWNATSNDDMFWRTASDGSLRINIDGTSNQNFGSAGDVTINNWHHIAVSFNSGTYEVYLDSNSLGTATTSNTVFNSGANFYIGDDNSATYFDGKIDQVRIFNKAISSSEVTSLYNETASTINTLQVLGDTSCIAAYPLGTGAGDIGNTYSGTPTNVTFNNPGHLTRNTSGTIESTVSANTEAGFSIVKYTGTGANGTVGHGLSLEPEFIITKNIDDSAENWNCWHTGLSGNGYRIILNTSQAEDGTSPTVWNSNINPTLTTFSLGSAAAANGNGNSHIAYCFHSVAGYSKIGTYTGNGSTTGTIVSLDFAPSFVMIKGADQTSDWIMIDNKRDTTNPNSARIDANGSGAEYTGENIMDLNSNGFQLKTSSASKNGLNNVFIYMAFK